MMKATIAEIKKQFNLDTLITLDFETFYRSRAKTIVGEDGKKIKIKSYTLKNTPYWKYIMDDQFRVTQFAYAVDHLEAIVLDPLDLDEWFTDIRERIAEGERIGLVCQNTQFDGCISSWVFGVHWTMYFDPMLLSKQQATGQSSSLKNQLLRVFPKDDTKRKGTELESADDIRDYREAGIWDAMARYNKDDVRLTRDLLVAYWNNNRTPLLEWHMIHYTLRGCIEPQFRVDKPLLEKEIQVKSELAEEIIGIAEQFLADNNGMEPEGRLRYSSDLRYKALLRALGIKVPMKMDKETFLMKPALGKSDPTYVKTQWEYPEFEPIFAARSIAKSNIAVTRATKMIECALSLDKGRYSDDEIGMYLNYNAAHTGRWSGGEKLNQQNLQQRSNHRLALRSPRGYQNAVCDLSNIELRTNLWFCEEDTLQANNHVGDLYCDMASAIYMEPVPPKSQWTHETKPIFNPKRQIGKVSELGMQYGMSAGAFQAYMAGGPFGMKPVFYSDSFCKQVKRAYDTMHPLVVQMWKTFQQLVLPAMCGESSPVTVGRGGCIKARKGEIELPSGRILCYPGMHSITKETQYGFQTNYQYDDGKRDRYKKTVWMYTYGAKVFQNVIQAIARDVIAFQQHEVEQYLQLHNYGWVIGSVHDELLNNVKEERAEVAFNGISSIMKIPPLWCHEIPLDCEGGYDYVYSK